MKSSELASVVGLGIGTIVLSWLTYRIVRKRFNHPQPDPTKWLHIGALKDINLLALKSCASVELETADCDEYGLTYKGFRNRSLLLLNDYDNMCFAGAHPQMLSIKSDILGEMLICLVECLPEHHVWFSRLLLECDSGVRLFINLKTTIQEKSWWRETQSDFMPIMVIHNKSLLDLNSRLAHKDQVHQPCPQRTRPNYCFSPENNSKMLMPDLGRNRI